ncbi:3-deoxy-D-manno-octulosonate 8-phosphate phosphatase KdsC [bacterium BMS3Abin04]|nr:3-deoxy-D-manno-octulosonate 8-phosphate phosphatase KdsC [bacterium BMS3Abin04]
MTDIAKKIQNIKIVLFDFDGVLIHSKEDELRIDTIVSELQSFVENLSHLGIEVGIATGREDDQIIEKIKTVRNLKVLTSTIDKVSLANVILEKGNFQCGNLFYMGDELFDLPLLNKCGVSAAPKNARREVKRAVDYVFKSETTEEILNELFNLLKTGREPGNGE